MIFYTCMPGTLMFELNVNVKECRVPLLVIFSIVTCDRIYWRYNVLYIAERCFESGGRIWDHVSCFPAVTDRGIIDKTFIRRACGKAANHWTLEHEKRQTLEHNKTAVQKPAFCGNCNHCFAPGSFHNC